MTCPVAPKARGAHRRWRMGRLDDNVLTTLYGAVEDGERWIELMDLLRQQFGVESVAAQYLVAARDDLRTVWSTRDTVSESRGALHDSWANSPANPRFRRPLGPLAKLEIDSDQRNLDYSAQDRRLLHEGLARCGLGPAFWISQQVDESRRFTLIFHRNPGDGRDLRAHEQTLLEAMAPHFRQAVRLWIRLNAAEMCKTLLEQSPATMFTAMAACDTRLQIHWMNSDARDLLRTSPLIALRNGHLACATAEAQAHLKALVEGRSDRPVMVLGRDPATQVFVRRRPFAAGSQPSGMALAPVMLVMTRADCPVRYDPADIAVLFGLTATEAALAAELAAGSSVSEFAEARGIAEGTARQHLKRVLAKTGAGRQSELVRRICQTVAG